MISVKLICFWLVVRKLTARLCALGFLCQLSVNILVKKYFYVENEI